MLKDLPTHKSYNAVDDLCGWDNYDLRRYRLL